MAFFIHQSPRPIASPCISICELRDDGLCSGCLRTTNEIAGWSTMSDLQRQHVMLQLLPQRRASESADVD